MEETGPGGFTGKLSVLGKRWGTELLSTPLKPLSVSLKDSFVGTCISLLLGEPLSGTAEGDLIGTGT